MDALTYFTDQLNITETINGDKAFYSSGSHCLDLYALIGGMRYHVDQLYAMFLKAYYEDRHIALKILLYARDIKGGLGERRIFRILLNGLGNFYPEVARKLLPTIERYGRYDDYFAFIGTPVESDVMTHIEKQLKADLANKEAGQPISLLAKWMPSINTSNSETRRLANELCEALKLSKAEYRKQLSYLRDGLIVENNLRTKTRVEDYQTTPTKALFKYKKAFIRSDADRFNAFIQNKAPKNMSTLYPYEIVRDAIEQDEVDETTKALYQKLWDNYPRADLDSQTIVVRDGSGSMYDEGAIYVATSLAILASEMLTGPFKNKFITFSSRPQLVTLDKGDIYDKIMTAMHYGDCSNTNIKKVFQLILDMAKQKDVKREDMPKRILIISDMEFDGDVHGISSYEFFKTEYAKSGYELPVVVFWNVCARHVQLPALEQDHVILVSGASPHVFDSIAKNKSIDPYAFMLETLKKYEVIDQLI